jgi:hypothetical protein
MQRAEREHRESYSRQIALALIPRRLDALETAWRVLFHLQAAESLTSDDINSLVGASMWMPDTTRESVLELLSNNDSPKEHLAHLRRQLVDATGVAEIDNALNRLSSWRT